MAAALKTKEEIFNHVIHTICEIKDDSHLYKAIEVNGLVNQLGRVLYLDAKELADLEYMEAGKAIKVPRFESHVLLELWAFYSVECARQGKQLIG